MIPFSILDLANVNEGNTLTDTFCNSRRLAQAADNHGFNRIWFAEHHGSRAVASAATAVLLSHIGAHTQSIRIGAGGVMLPNHSPLVIAEQFGTLASLYPERIDLGLGRAPGTDMATARALRRNFDGKVDRYPDDIQELQLYFGPIAKQQTIIAIPGADTHVPLWLLGSSLYSAQLAAKLGLPFAFASHFAPDKLMEAITVYRRDFQPSEQLKSPYVMVGLMSVIAETDSMAEYLFTSIQQQFVNLHRGVNSAYPRPVDSMDGLWAPHEEQFVRHTFSLSAVGSAETVKHKIISLLEKTNADELIFSIPLYDTKAKLDTVKMLSESGLMKAVK